MQQFLEILNANKSIAIVTITKTIRLIVPNLRCRKLLEIRSIGK